MMTLKEQNQFYVIMYVVINFAILFVLYKYTSFDSNGFFEILKRISAKDGVFFILLSFITLVFQGMTSSETKGILIFWKFKNYLPASQAFSKYAKENFNRIDRKKLINKYGKFPRNPDKQNRLWFKIYEDTPDKRIDKVHKDYLLFRECASLTIYFILFFPLFLWYTIDIENKIVMLYMIVLIVEYLIIRKVAKTYAERFVENVLAIASHK